MSRAGSFINMLKGSAGSPNHNSIDNSEAGGAAAGTPSRHAHSRDSQASGKKAPPKRKISFRKSNSKDKDAAAHSTPTPTLDSPQKKKLNVQEDVMNLFLMVGLGDFAGKLVDFGLSKAKDVCDPDLVSMAITPEMPESKARKLVNASKTLKSVFDDPPPAPSKVQRGFTQEQVLDAFVFCMGNEARVREVLSSMELTTRDERITEKMGVEKPSMQAATADGGVDGGE